MPVVASTIVQKSSTLIEILRLYRVYFGYKKAQTEVWAEIILGSVLVPWQRAADLILGDPRFEEVLLFPKIHNFTHPWEWIFHPRELL